MATRPVWRRAFTAFRAHHGPAFAAAVSFWAILSLLPTVLLAVSVFGHVVSSDEAFRRTMVYLDEVFTGDTRALEGPMREAVETRGEIGILGLVFLLWSGTEWIVTLESALNVQFGAPPRAFLISRLMAVLLFILVALLLLLSTTVTGALAAVTRLRVPGLQIPLEGIPFLWQAVGYALPVLFSVATFSLIYWLLPNVKVAPRAVLCAGTVAGIAWDAAKLGYAWYLSRVARFDALFGSVGALFGLVLWVYYSSVIALLGGEWAHAMQEAVAGGASKQKRGRDADRRSRIADRRAKSKPRQRR
jgi:membrane protein